MIVTECKIGELRIHVKDIGKLQVSVKISEVELTLSPTNWGDSEEPEALTKAQLTKQKSAGYVSNLQASFLKNLEVEMTNIVVKVCMKEGKQEVPTLMLRVKDLSF